MDLSPGDARDQVLSLLSSLMINASVSGVSPKAGSQAGSNSVSAQVRVA